MKTKTERTPEVSKAQRKYRKKLIASGRQRLPTSFIPVDVVEILQQLIDSGQADSLSGAVWLAVRQGGAQGDLAGDQGEGRPGGAGH